MYSESPEGAQVIIGSLNRLNIGYDIATSNTIRRTWTRNLFRPRHAPIPLGHSDVSSLIPVHLICFITDPCSFDMQGSVMKHMKWTGISDETYEINRDQWWNIWNEQGSVMEHMKWTGISDETYEINRDQWWNIWSEQGSVMKHMKWIGISDETYEMNFITDPCSFHMFHHWSLFISYVSSLIPVHFICSITDPC